MDCLLFGGAQSVGKSESIYRITKHLLSIGFKDITNSVPTDFDDFKAILEGQNTLGKQIKIIINTPTDTVSLINDFKKFFQDNGGTYDILISSVRDNFWQRDYFFSMMNLDQNSILEIPLAKITRRGESFDIALDWYQDKIDKLIIQTMSNQPFNLRF